MIGLRTTEPVLSLRNFGAAFGERVILSDITLELPSTGIFVLLGPGGTGKSTLLRTLAGANAANPSLRTWGDVRFAGRPLGENGLPVLVSQSARLMIASVFDHVINDFPDRRTLTPLQQRDLACELLLCGDLAHLIPHLDEPVVKLTLGVQRQLAMLRLLAANPPLIFVDEPTTDLDEVHSERLLTFIQRESEARAVLVVLHNQAHARRLSGQVALLAGGVIREIQPIPDFFDTPRSSFAKEFVRNGYCLAPAPDAKPEELEAGTDAPPPLPDSARNFVSDYFGPRGFLWLKKGMLAGTPRPGIVVDIDQDLQALQRVGVTVLVSLTQTPMDATVLQSYGIRNVASPIPDMHAPPVHQALEICRDVEANMRAGEVVAVHCRAGLGRTGTVLACYLIWEGCNALDALESVRRVEPKWVQSDKQAAFLEEFDRFLSDNPESRRRSPRPTLNNNSGQHIT
jgi:atypical dual specificity phosphatase